MKTFLRISFFFFLVTQICFAQWYQQNSGITSNLNSVHFENAVNGWAVADSGIILHTTNAGQEWIEQTSGTSKHLNGVWFTNLNTSWVVGDSGKILKTSNGGQEWIEQTSGTSIDLNSVCFIDINRGWVVGSVDYDSGIILGTTNGGINWISQSYDTIQPSLNSVCFVDSIRGWAFGLHALLRTTDGGHTWIEMEVPGDGLLAGQFLDLNTGWLSVYVLGVVHGSIVYTTNGGLDWFYGEGPPTALSIYFVDSNNGWAVGHHSMGNISNIYNSIDGGRNWIAQSPITGATLNSVYFTDANNGWVVGENGTILHTSNGGVVPVELTSFTAEALDQKVILRWTTATELNNNGFEIQRKVAESDFATVGFVRGEGTTTNHKDYSYIDKDLVDGKYFYRLKQVDYNGAYEYSDVIEVDVRSLNEYALEQNFPNPYNSFTTIGYVLREKNNAKMILLNAIGEEMAILVNEEQEKGFHKVEFNASTLASGVYFYRLQAGDFVQTRKMILLK